MGHYNLPSHRPTNWETTPARFKRYCWGRDNDVSRMDRPLPFLRLTQLMGMRRRRPPSFEIMVEPRFSEAAAMVAHTKELCG